MKYSLLPFFTIIVLTYSNAATVELSLAEADDFEALPRFWTNTGFCPMGRITNGNITNHLLSDDVHTSLELLSALPNSGISHVRIHWLLELVRFVKFAPAHIPVYDFRHLDDFLDQMVQANLSVGFELMGNPNWMFNTNKVRKGALWENLVFSILRRYKIRYGLNTMKRWRLETWNEPDLKTYNLLNFTLPDYLEYVIYVRRALDAAGRTANNTHFELSGPAGLFKNKETHSLCWGILRYCNEAIKCPLDQITFHRKGSGLNESEILSGSLELIRTIQKELPKIKDMRFSNNEADPIAGWSTPRPFQSDVRYARALVLTVLEHWSAKRNIREFRNLHTISHDNAFLSYHPYEFDQRTLFARFQMNETRPRHSQFVQKPAYAALGLLSNLAERAQDVSFPKQLNLTFLASKDRPERPLYSAIIFVSNDGPIKRTDFKFRIALPMSESNETFATITEVCEADITDPVKIWKFYGSPPYPNATVRRLMRLHQGSMILETRILKSKKIGSEGRIDFGLNLRPPWIALVRICSSKNTVPSRATNLRIRKVNPTEVLLFWMETLSDGPSRCIRTYDVHFKPDDGSDEWKEITFGEHVPFLSYHFQPDDGKVSGQYKVRSIDLFGRNSSFSEVAIWK